MALRLQKTPPGIFSSSSSTIITKKCILTKLMLVCLKKISKLSLRFSKTYRVLLSDFLKLNRINIISALVDVSGQRTTIELEGPNAREVIAHLWEQDLRDKSFPAGSVSQGLIAKAPVIVCHMAPLRYRIMVRSSFAVHVWKAVVDAGVEWV